MGFTGFYLVLLGFYLFILGFTQFYLVFHVFYWVSLGFDWVLLGFTGFYQVFLDDNPNVNLPDWVFALVAVDDGDKDLASLSDARSVAGFYRVLLDGSGFYRPRKHLGMRCVSRSDPRSRRCRRSKAAISGRPCLASANRRTCCRHFHSSIPSPPFPRPSAIFRSNPVGVPFIHWPPCRNGAWISS